MSTLKVANIESQSGGGVSAKISDVGGGPLNNRNRIINGSMEVAQRGTSSTGNGYVSLDRWYVNQSGGSTTFSQETFTVGSEIEGLKNYAKFAVSTSSDYTGIRQNIEDVRSIPAGTITVSFWAKGTNPSGDLAVRPFQNFGSTGSASVDITGQTVELTSSWQRFELQFTVPSISGKTVDAADNYFGLNIGQGTDTGTTAWELDITGVQLEVGNTMTSFEHRSFGDELARCQRYYYKVVASSSGDPLRSVGFNTASTDSRVLIPFPVTMRAAPSALEQSGTAGDYSVRSNSNVTCNSVPAYFSASTDEALVDLSVSSGLTAGWGCFTRAVNTDAFFAWSAEL